jgi:hypothetical protein
MARRRRRKKKSFLSAIFKPARKRGRPQKGGWSGLRLDLAGRRSGYRRKSRRSKGGGLGGILADTIFSLLLLPFV